MALGFFLYLTAPGKTHKSSVIKFLINFSKKKVAKNYRFELNDARGNDLLAILNRCLLAIFRWFSRFGRRRKCTVCETRS